MSVCQYCGKEMNSGESCRPMPVKIVVNGQEVELPPVKFGDETDYAVRLQYKVQFPNDTPEQHAARVDAFNQMCRLGKYADPNENCPDCSVRRGGYHHPGCDKEECPRCHLQLHDGECPVEPEEPAAT